MRVTELDREDDAGLQTWWAVQDAARRADWPDDAPFTLAEARGIATGDFGGTRAVLALARDDRDRAVGCSSLRLPSHDNTWKLELEIQVHPEHRRRGAGRALVAHAEELAAREGRRTIEAGYEEPLGGPPPAAAFAEALGFEEALKEHRRDLFLPVDAGLLDRLEKECLAFADRYEIVTWTGATPDELVAGMLELEQAMAADIPHGSFEREPPKFDEARLRSIEQTVAAMHVDAFLAGAVASEGLVAYTVVGVPQEAPEHARQWATVVLGRHRGHRLGTLIKIANLRAITTASPRTRKITTWNGESNVQMSRVNDALGFVMTARAVLVQKRLASAP